DVAGAKEQAIRVAAEMDGGAWAENFESFFGTEDASAYRAATRNGGPFVTLSGPATIPKWRVHRVWNHIFEALTRDMAFRNPILWDCVGDIDNGDAATYIVPGPPAPAFFVRLGPTSLQAANVVFFKNWVIHPDPGEI